MLYDERKSIQDSHQFGSGVLFIAHLTPASQRGTAATTTAVLRSAGRKVSVNTYAGASSLRTTHNNRATSTRYILNYKIRFDLLHWFASELEVPEAAFTEHCIIVNKAEGLHMYDQIKLPEDEITGR